MLLYFRDSIIASRAAALINANSRSARPLLFVQTLPDPPSRTSIILQIALDSSPRLLLRAALFPRHVFASPFDVLACCFFILFYYEFARVDRHVGALPKTTGTVRNYLKIKLLKISRFFVIRGTTRQ